MSEQTELLHKARQYALDLERHARIEAAQSHLSPTDLALFSRLVVFLRYDIAQAITGNATYLLSEDGDN